MKLSNKYIWYEHFVYLILWVIIFVLPIVDFWHNRSFMTETEIRGMVIHSWLFLLPMLLLFVINDFFLAPKFLLKRKLALYLMSTIALIFLILMSFSLLERTVLMDIRPRHFPFNEKVESRLGGRIISPINGQSVLEDGKYGPQSPDDLNPDNGPIMDEGPMPGVGPQMIRNDKSLHSSEPGRAITTSEDTELKNRKGPNLHMRHIPNGIEHDGFFSLPMAPMVSRFFIIVFILGFNLAIKFVFRSISQEQREKEQEKQKLQSELQYLKYQINPHFFMNTLNNIHALIDVDSVKAQETILELSKMMRYVLYDSSNRLISLNKEITFLRNYIGLMSLRYTSKVRVSMSVPDIIPDVSVPPLLFISFVENAFKHGISYQQKSFIDVSIEIEQDKVIFHCENSIITNADEKKKSPGIGIENTRRRLNLLFGTDYTLSIKSDNNLFKVLLIIPTVC